MHRSFLKSFALAVVTALSLTLSPNALAQAITTSSLSGTVLNEKSVPVADATVAVTHEPTGSAYTAKTRADGTFVLRGLRPGGPYSVTTEATGFVRNEQKEVYLDIDTGANLSFRLASEDVVKLETFKVTLTGSYKVQLATTGGLAATLLNALQRGFGPEWVDEFPRRVQALTLAEVNGAIKKHLHVDTMVTVMAGTIPGPAAGK